MCLFLCLGPTKYIKYLVFDPDSRLRPAGRGGVPPRGASKTFGTFQMIQVLEALGVFQMFEIPGTFATSRVPQTSQTLISFGPVGTLQTMFPAFGYMFQ